jgi:hypothetical protein
MRCERPSCNHSRMRFGPTFAISGCRFIRVDSSLSRRRLGHWDRSDRIPTPRAAPPTAAPTTPRPPRTHTPRPPRTVARRNPLYNSSRRGWGAAARPSISKPPKPPRPTPLPKMGMPAQGLPPALAPGSPGVKGARGGNFQTPVPPLVELIASCALPPDPHAERGQPTIV